IISIIQIYERVLKIGQFELKVSVLKYPESVPALMNIRWKGFSADLAGNHRAGGFRTQGCVRSQGTAHAGMRAIPGNRARRDACDPRKARMQGCVRSQEGRMQGCVRSQEGRMQGCV